MCGRVACTLPPQRIQRIGRVRRRIVLPAAPGVAPRPRYNVGPMSRLPCIYTNKSNNGSSNGERCVEYMKWGLQGKGTQHLSTVNARIETVETSKIYSPHLKSRERCILVVDGFYEWSTKKDGNKIPYFIRFKNGFAEKPIPGGDGSNDDDDKASQKDDWPIDKQFWEDDRQTVREPLLMACLYAPPTTDDDPHSFTILTMDSVGPISKIHDRMPVSLTPEVAADWIDCTEASDSSLLHKIADNARHVALNDITVYEVPPLANNMRNDTPDCLLPLATWKKKQFDNGLGRFFKKQDSSTTKSKTSSSDTKEPSAKKARVEH